MNHSSCPPGFTLATVNPRRWLVLAALAASLVAVSPTAAAAAGAKHRLHAFASCSRFVHYARRHASNELLTRGVPVPQPLPVVRTPAPNGVVAPQSESAPASGGAGQDFSGTNVQEAGVDEPDIVKTDGKHIFAAENGRLYALDARSDPPKLLGSIPLDGYGQELLLSGDKLLVMSGAPIAYPIDYPPVPRPVYPGMQSSTVTLVDVSDPAAMTVVKTMSVNGGFLDARLTGHTARVIFSATPRVLPLLASAQAASKGAK